MRMIIFAMFLAISHWAFAIQADACEGDKVLFQEDFSVHDATWGAPSPKLEIGNGKAIFRPTASTAQWQLETGFVFDDADICLTVSLLETSDPTRGGAGLVFWANGTSNFYVLIIASNGYYSVRRQIAGQWTPEVIAWTPSNAIKQGPNQPNILRVTLRGQSVAITINDNEIVRFRAQPPSISSLVGIYAGSAPGKEDAWQFTNLKVTNVK